MVTEYDRHLGAPFQRAGPWMLVRAAPASVRVVCGEALAPEVVGFLNRARAALQAADKSVDWFRRLGYDFLPDGLPMFDGADLADRAARVLRRHVPILAARLGVRPPLIAGPALTSAEVFEHVQGWCVDARAAGPGRSGQEAASRGSVGPPPVAPDPEAGVAEDRRIADRWIEMRRSERPPRYERLADWVRTRRDEFPVLVAREGKGGVTAKSIKAALDRHRKRPV